MSYVASRAWVFNMTAAGLAARSLLRAKARFGHTYWRRLNPRMISAGFG
jgi:hypothetical protein